MMMNHQKVNFVSKVFAPRVTNPTALMTFFLLPYTVYHLPYILAYKHRNFVAKMTPKIGPVLIHEYCLL